MEPQSPGSAPSLNPNSGQAPAAGPDPAVVMPTAPVAPVAAAPAPYPAPNPVPAAPAAPADLMTASAPTTMPPQPQPDQSAAFGAQPAQPFAGPSVPGPVPGAPSGPMPGEAPAAGQMPSYGAPMPAPQGGQSKKKMMILIAVIVATLSVLGVGTYFAMQLFGGMKLESYKGSDFSAMVPVGYTEKEEEGGTVTFTEPGDKKTASAVGGQVLQYPVEVTEENLDDTVKSYKESLEKTGSSDFGGQEYSDIKVTNTTHNGNKALRVTADLTEDGHTQKLFMVIGFTVEEYYVVALKVDATDPALEKKVEDVLSSFKVL